jgi:hypothetical protein
MKDFFKKIKRDVENRLATESVDERLMMQVSVEVQLFWRGNVPDLVGRICTEMEVMLLDNETIYVFDPKNPRGSRIIVTSCELFNGVRELIVAQVWADSTYNLTIWRWPIRGVEGDLGEPAMVDLGEDPLLKN